MSESVKPKNRKLPLWVFAVVCIAIIAAVVLVFFVINPLSTPIEEIDEHLELLAYPSNAILSPGEFDFNVTVNNNSSVTYDVVLSYLLGDSTYQKNYVTFSNEIYKVAPGTQDLQVWITVKPEAPSLLTTLEINVHRATTD